MKRRRKKRKKRKRRRIPQLLKEKRKRKLDHFINIAALFNNIIIIFKSRFKFYVFIIISN